MRKLLLAFLSVLFAIQAYGQECNIKAMAATEGCAPLSTSWEYENSSGKTVTALVWDFGNGELSNDANPTHIFTQPGIYPVSLKLTFSDGTTCSSVYKSDVHVYETPWIDNYLEITPAATQCYKKNGVLNHFCFKFKYDKKDTSSVIYCILNTGDGDTTSTHDTSVHMFCHTYDSPGVYTISLTLANGHGCQAYKSWTQKVTVLRDEPYTSWEVEENAGIISGKVKGGVAGGGYTWYVNDSPLAKGDSFSYATTHAGTYMVHLVASYGPCSADKDTSVMVALSGIRNTAAGQEIQLYPNPATQQVYLRWGAALDKDANLTITDAMGRSVINKALPAGNREEVLDVAGLKPGIYYIKMQCGSQQWHSRLLKMNNP